jgi:diacylglycerol kinase (ATP)
MATVHVLGNRVAGAGRAEPALAAVVAAIRAQGHDVDVLTPRARHEVDAVVRNAVVDGAARVVVVGGDGLAHLAAQSLACAGVTMGLVPVGTGNDFARGLGLPLDDIDAAVRRALMDPVPFDALRTSRGWIASVGTVGFAATVNARANGLRWPRGRARYTLATLAELPRLAPQRLRIDLDGEELDVSASLVAIANTAFFGGGMAICPDADPTDGLLDVALVDAVGRLRLLRFFPTVFSGRHVMNSAVTMRRARRVRIEALGDDPAGKGLWGDGEPVGSLPVDIDVVPGALPIAGARTNISA